jgi:hypothetical protein
VPAAGGSPARQATGPAGLINGCTASVALASALAHRSARPSSDRSAPKQIRALTLGPLRVGGGHGKLRRADTHGDDASSARVIRSAVNSSDFLRGTELDDTVEIP